MHQVRRLLFPLVSCTAGAGLLLGCSALTGESRTCTADFRFGLAVTVVDSLTDAPPSSALLIVRDGAFADTLGPATPQPVVLNGSPVLILFTAGEREGTYDLTVRATGYRDWTRVGVTVTKDVCHVRRTDITARLQR